MDTTTKMSTPNPNSPVPESNTPTNTRQFEAMSLSDSDDQQNTPGPAKAKAIDFSDSEDDLDGTSNAFDNLNLPAKLKRLMRDTNFTNLSDDSDSEDDPIQDNSLFRTPAAVKTAAVQEILKATPPAPPKKPAVDFLAQHSDYSSSEEETPSRRRKPRTAIAPRRQKIPARESAPASGKSSGSEENSSEEEEDTPKSDRPPRRQMSKKAELLMHKENQRIARTAAAQLQPRTKKLMLGGVVDKLKDRQVAESDSEEEMLPRVENPPPAPSRKQQAIMAFLEDDDDSDIEIVGGPSRRAYELASPEQSRNPHHQFWRSPPVQRKTMTHRDLNRRLQEQMTKEITSLREEYEKKARAQGSYLAPEERAKKQLEREKEAKAIEFQVRQHFSKDTSRSKQSNPENAEEEEEAVLVYSGDEDEFNEPQEEENDDDSDKESLDVTLKDDDETMSQDELEPVALEPKIGTEERKRKRNNALLLSDEDEDEDDDDDDRQKKQKEGVSLNAFLKNAPQDTPAAEPTKKSKNAYFDAEAQESEDEFYGAGGADLSDDEHLDQFEQDGMLVDKSDEHVDEAALRTALNNQLAETDKHMVDRLIKDIMSGDLRRRRAAKESGLMLDDFDIYDDNDNDLVALRLAAAERRRKLQEESGDVLELLAKDEKTKAFAMAGQPLPDATDTFDLSDAEDNNEQEKEPVSKVSMIMESDEEIEIPIDDEDEREDMAIVEDNLFQHMITSPMVDEEERVDVVDRVRDDPSASPTMLIRRRNRLRHLLSDGGVLGSSSEGGPRVGLTAAQQLKERKISHRTTKNAQLNDTSPVPKRQSRLLSMFK